MSQQQKIDMAKYFYRASATDFMKIPGSPVAYWTSEKLRKSFESTLNVDQVSPPRIGMMTTDNTRFLRGWHEISFKQIGFNFLNIQQAIESDFKWFPYNKGGGFRKWAGFQSLVVNWENGGQEISAAGMTSFRGKDFYFKEGLTWSDVATGDFSCRHTKTGSIFDIKGTSAFPEKERIGVVASVLNSKPGSYILNILNPTMSYQSGDIRRVPLPDSVLALSNFFNCAFSDLASISSSDWSFYESSFDFTYLHLLHAENHQQTLSATYQSLRNKWRELIIKMQRLEEENNRILIDAYGLNDELSPEVPLEEITLTCNPYYRYGGNKSDEELETMLQCDTMEELASYAIGCMMGRYSLDKPGLILASQGETLQDYLRQIPVARFAPDDDGILPLTDQEWFADDATNRFREFLRTAWGEQTLQENLDFVAESLCLHAIKPKKGEDSLDTIRSYLSSQFYKDHLKTYKKRPIYWLFSSGRYKAFECLVYLHRYNEGTLARIRTEYVIPLTAKLNAHASKLEKDIDVSSSTAEKKALEKQLATLHNQQAELATFDEKLRHFADQRIRLDLDDGVKVNYGKFGDLLSDVNAITGGSDE